MITNLIAEAALFSAVFLFIYMNLWFILALILKDNSIIDYVWGTGFILVAAVSLLVGNAEYGLDIRKIIITSIVTLWGFRLAFHIYLRNRGKGEDWRYKKWRDEWGKWFLPRTYLQIFMLQGILLFIISTPIIIVNSTPESELFILGLVGTLIWLVGFYFETVGDWQLSRFKKNPANSDKIMTTGLWKYTRHPNYFGEVTMWWGIYYLAITVKVPLGLFSIVSPLLISFLILKVSGVTMLESKFEGNPEFEAYKLRTNAFIPWFPKKV